MSLSCTLPPIIQGGMGVAISDWKLAKAVASEGHLGVISGTGISTVMVRRLQLGDIGGHVRRALEHFPFAEMANKVLKKFFIEGGKDPNAPYKLAALPAVPMRRDVEQELVISNFIEVFLAKEGHTGTVGINLLEKIQLPTLGSLYGAMLADVDVVLMGAGIPLAIPGILDKFSRGESANLRLDVRGSIDNPVYLDFDPANFHENPPELKRPKFLTIVSTDIVARTMVKKASGEVDGFVVESYVAGGHNAPPRRVKGMDSQVYGERDAANLDKMIALEKPFWLAGAAASPKGLADAISRGARGIQMGTIFALCSDSGMESGLRTQVLQRYFENDLEVLTDFEASPTGYPFKVAQSKAPSPWNGHKQMPRKLCDLGYLRYAFMRENGSVGWRCSSEPLDDFVSKGGDLEETPGKVCLCNGLLSTAGFPQVKGGEPRAPLVTLGDDLSFLPNLATKDEMQYDAKAVLKYMVGG